MTSVTKVLTAMGDVLCEAGYSADVSAAIAAAEG
jgi:hypothetical protein